MSKPEVIVITGPTATGKTSLGASLAKKLDGEVVSADSMQVYRLMDIGTAKPGEGDVLGVPHHLIGIVPPWDDYSVARYIRDAENCIDEILGRGKTPLLVGGTGLYIDSLLSGRVFSEKGDAELRRGLEHEFDRIGGEAMLLRLKAFDPESAADLHANDRKRIVRALEIYEQTGKTISQHDRETMTAQPRYDFIKFALTFSDRQALYERIEKRVDLMIQSGLEAEVRGLVEIGVSSLCTAMQAIGYKEIASAIRGEYSIDDAIDKIKMESRRYAKRQLSWLRRDENVKWIVWENEIDLDMAVSYIFDTCSV